MYPRHEVSIGNDPWRNFWLYVWCNLRKSTRFVHVDWKWIAPGTLQLDANWKQARRWQSWWWLVLFMWWSGIPAIATYFWWVSKSSTRFSRSFVEHCNVKCLRICWVGICSHQQAMGVSQLLSRIEAFSIANCQILHNCNIPLKFEDMFLRKSDDEFFTAETTVSQSTNIWIFGVDRLKIRVGKSA